MKLINNALALLKEKLNLLYIHLSKSGTQLSFHLLRIIIVHYNVKHKLFFHTFNKEIEDNIKVDNGLSYFNGERNCSVYNEAEAVDYVKAIHKLGEIDKLFLVPQEIYDSEYGEVGATSLKILRCWIS